MTTVQLRTFLSLVKMQSFSKTAEALDYAQSSVSGQIKSLEEEVGCALFERIGRKVYMTGEGKAFLPFATRMYDTYLEATQTIGGNKKPSGTLTIGAPESLSVYKLPQLFMRFRELYPNVELKVKMDNCCNIYKMLNNNQIDLAFVLEDAPVKEGYECQSIGEEEILLLSNKPIEEKDNDDALSNRIASETMMLVEELSCCYNDVFMNHLKEDNVEPGCIALYGSVEMIKKCVESSMGFGVLPKMAVEEELSSGTLYNMNYKHKMAMHGLLLKHPDKWMSSAMNALVDLAKEVL